MAITNYAEAWIDQYANQLPTINFVSGDYSSLKESIRQYVVNQCPEDYNDWANSSEVGMFVNGLSYLGSIINYRVDLNAHDIFPSTTERRQSLLNFVKMLSYSPKRNIAALGIAKIVSVKTTETVYDSIGNSLKDLTINWNDAANQNWQEQFLTILNAVFSSTNPFGKPVKKATYDGITTQLYELNDTKNNACIYPFTANLNGSTRQFEVVNADIDTTLNAVFEKSPIPEQGLNILYRNDGTGNSSANTGFFVYWKQGSLRNQYVKFDERIENNSLDVNQSNINNYDVWFQKVDYETKAVKENWKKIADNEYLVYNNLDMNERNIFKVETRDNDQITLRFSDGKFGTIPIGYFRVWYRTSSGNEDIYIKAADIRNISIDIPYYSHRASDNSVYYLTLEFSISDSSHITQSVAQETMNYIKERAPQVYSTQNRMVTGSDYNYFPKSSTQRLKLIKAIERTYSGNTRYIDFNDPTGMYQDLNLIGEDGYLYSNTGLTDLDIVSEDWSSVDELYEIINKELRKLSLSNFYYENISTITPMYLDDYYKWRSLYDYGRNCSIGYFGSGIDRAFISFPYNEVAKNIQIGTMMHMVAVEKNTSSIDNIIEETWVLVQDIKENLNINDGYTQSITINETLNSNYDWIIKEYYKPFIITFPEDTKAEILELLKGDTSFGLRYNKDNNLLQVVPFNALSQGDWEEQDELEVEDESCTDWLVKVEYNSSNIWKLTSRYVDYVFGSENDISFFFNTSIKNNNGTFATEDYIKIFKTQDNELLNLSHDYYWKPCNVIMYSDGYIEPNEFKVYGYDDDKDSSVDNPKQFKELSKDSKQKLFFGKDMSNDYTTLYNNVVEIETMWDKITEGNYKGYASTNVSNYYYTQIPCSVYPAGIKIPYRLDENGNPTDYFEIRADKDMILSNGEVVYEGYLIAQSGKTYNYDVVDVGHIVEYEIDKDGNTIIISDEEVGNPIEKGSLDSGDIDKIIVQQSSSGNKKYKVFDKVPTLCYWSSSDNKMDIMKENEDYIIKEGIRNMIFSWKHYSTTKYLIDPSTTNIIDMYVLTRDHWNDIQTWINNGKQDSFPKSPSEYELKSMFNDLENYKMITDTMVWHPIGFKLLFGNGASEELKAIFKVIKNEATTLSDNEIKQQVVNCIDEFFAQMNPGETFFFTQLSTYIHKQLGENIGTVLLVPSYNDEKFGNLFEIQSNPDEILISSASLDDVQIITKITDYNIRISQ